MKTPLDNALEEIEKKITFFDKKYETQYGRPDEDIDKIFTKKFTFAFFDCNSTSGWSACTFSYGIAKREKTVKESIDIADDLFVLLMRGNGLNPNSMFDDQNLIKESIRSETIERVAKCKEWTKEAIPKIVLEKTGKPATQEFIDGATKTFALWWMSTYETIMKGGN